MDNMFYWSQYVDGNIVHRRYGDESQTVTISEFCMQTRVTHAKSFYVKSPEHIKSYTYTSPLVTISVHINIEGKITKIKVFSRAESYYGKKLVITLNHFYGKATHKDKNNHTVVESGSETLFQQLSGLSVPLTESDITYLCLFLI